MLHSAVLTGGGPEATGAVIGALFIFFMMRSMGSPKWSRWRVSIFYVLWQTFTPVRPFVFDMCLLVVATILLELFCGLLDEYRASKKS